MEHIFAMPMVIRSVFVISVRPFFLALNQAGDFQFLLVLFISAPWLMKFLSGVETVAMFMVGGGVLLYGFHHLRVSYRSRRLVAACGNWFTVPI